MPSRTGSSSEASSLPRGGKGLAQDNQPRAPAAVLSPLLHTSEDQNKHVGTCSKAGWPLASFLAEIQLRALYPHKSFRRFISIQDSISTQRFNFHIECCITKWYSTTCSKSVASESRMHGNGWQERLSARLPGQLSRPWHSCSTMIFPIVLLQISFVCCAGKVSYTRKRLGARQLFVR